MPFIGNGDDENSRGLRALSGVRGVRGYEFREVRV